MTRSNSFNRYWQAALLVMAVVLLGYVIHVSRAAGPVGDINNDGTVNVVDLSILLSDWGTSTASADLNHDGTVNILDLSALLSNWGKTAPAPSPSPSVSTSQTPGNDPSGVPAPGAISGFTQLCREDFAAPAATGSWGTTDSNKVVYSSGCNWTEYPDGWPSTYTNGAPGYEPSRVLSVHDGELDFYLTNINGVAEGANPSPVLSTGSRYQTYGKYVYRVRFDSVAGYHNAWLLWPQTQADGPCGESDFPEFDLNSTTVSAFAHYGCSSSQDAFHKAIDPTQWHTYEQDWTPTARSYYIDGVLLGTSTHAVYSSPERLQLQVEPSGAAPGGTGHVYVDWVVVYAPL